MQDPPVHPDPVKAPKLFFVAGEPSGDQHAANLIRALRQQRPGAQVTGLGGPRMQEAGCTLRQNMMDMSWMWFSTALFGLHRVFKLQRQTLDYLDRNRPHALVLVDFPGFNLTLARFVRKRRIPVLYYISPQIWAWASWRIRKIRRRVTKMLCIFPFEESIYREAGVPVEYVGHPLFDHLRSVSLDEDFPQMIHRAQHPRVVGLLPGSRRQVVGHSVPVMFKAAELIYRALPDTHFVVSCQQEQFRPLIEPWLTHAAIPVQMVVQHTLELMKRADLCLASSGTTTLELAHFGTPMVVLYRINPAGYGVSQLMMNTRHFSLVNILAGRQIVPEFLLWRDDAARIAYSALAILRDPLLQEETARELQRIRDMVDHPGASDKAARAVLRFVDTVREAPIHNGTDNEAQVLARGGALGIGEN